LSISELLLPSIVIMVVYYQIAGKSVGSHHVCSLSRCGMTGSILASERRAILMGKKWLMLVLAV
jgi:hypothetical protein